MKRILPFILICTLCAGFVACGDDDKDEPEKETPFTWKGDWNDPENPDFKPDGYNPIVGDWHSLDNPKIRLEFTNKFVIKRYIYKDSYNKWDTEIWAKKYEINDIGIKYVHVEALNIDEWKILIENNEKHLMIRDQLPTKDKWRKYKRYKPN